MRLVQVREEAPQLDGAAALEFTLPEKPEQFLGRPLAVSNLPQVSSERDAAERIRTSGLNLRRVAL
jgi:hypothetical protein